MRLLRPSRVIAVAALIVLVVVLWGRRWTVTSEAGAPCTVRAGMTKEELMRDCGVPTGLMYQPKIAEGLFPPRLCSAPVYLYGSSAIVFGCSSTVTGVDEDWNVGGYKGYVEMGVDALLQELEAHANEEAAIAELASPRVPAADRARADQMLERLSQSPSPRMRDAATRALARRR